MYPQNVWRETDELAFHEKALYLEACSRSQKEESQSQLDVDVRNKLDLPSARHFLDDFALIAAGPGGASNVTAACLELSQSNEDVITIRVAKNEDFNLQARQRLSQITAIMNQVRERDLSIAMAQDLCFELVAEGCRSRISKQIEGQNGLWNLVHQFCTPSQQLGLIVDSQTTVPPAEPGKTGTSRDINLDENDDAERLAKSHWTEIRELIDKLHVTTDLEAIKQLARLAYDVRHSISFRNLVRTQCQLQKQSSQILERMGKVAKFFRSAVSLVQVAGCATLKHTQIKVETVPSISRRVNVLQDYSIENMRRRMPALSTRPRLQIVEIQRLLRRWHKYIVHAEMLLLTFYEEHPEIVLATNYIGISKRSCYLCANFIRFHNFFAVEGQHQQLYCLWTLPAEVTFESQARGAIFMKALTDLDLLLARRMDEVTRPQHKPLAFLKESVANFSRATIIARAHSLENLGVVVESDEDLSLSTSRTPLGNGGEHPDVQLETRERDISKLHQERVKEHCNTELSSLVEEISSPLHLKAVEDLQAHIGMSPRIENSTSKDLDEEFQYSEKRSHQHIDLEDHDIRENTIVEKGQNKLPQPSDPTGKQRRKQMLDVRRLEARFSFPTMLLHNIRKELHGRGERPTLLIV
ncbi:uncharacterized protein RAG0_17055 [Rhynchosporium agropyri]|uniref:Uncharacterized protein n=1 Tax=Rhynchosporium agropyri TaxID=914238 RepID=A0A1E1LST5_9HELO|nr:uncharacterized protein RAG0_17055 [Rhynchosporium agropyri]